MTSKLHNQRNGRRRVVYEMTVTLDGVEPAIWRRVRVPADYTLDRLHDVIQIVMGWQDNHLHHFEIGKHRFTELPTELSDADSHEYADESRVRLDEFLPEVLAPFRYEYNQVDEWSLMIAVERTVRIPMDDPARIALTCLDGGSA